MAYDAPMSITAAVAVISGITALVVALGHLVADVNGTMDKIRKTPIRQPAAPQPPGTPPAGG